MYARKIQNNLTVISGTGILKRDYQKALQEVILACSLTLFTLFFTLLGYKPQMILMKHKRRANGQAGHTPALSKPGASLWKRIYACV